MNVLVIALDAASPVEVPQAEVLVVAPALNSRLQTLALRRGRGATARRASAREPPSSGSSAAASTPRGRVGDGDPLQAIADALPLFAADEIVIAVRPPSARRAARRTSPRALRASRPARRGGAARRRMT